MKGQFHSGFFVLPLYLFIYLFIYFFGGVIFGGAYFRKFTVFSEAYKTVRRMQSNLKLFHLSVKSVICICSGFVCIITLSNWLKKFMPLCYQSRTLKPKPIITHMHSSTFCQLAVFALSFNWFTGLSVTFMLSQSFNFVLVL